MNTGARWNLSIPENFTHIKYDLVLEIVQAHERGEILEREREGHAMTVHKSMNKPGSVLATKSGLLCVTRPGTAVRLLDNKRFDLQEVEFPSHETAFLYESAY